MLMNGKSCLIPLISVDLYYITVIYIYELNHNCFIRGIKHDFPFISIRKVPREMLKTKGKARGFQHLPRDLANVNE